jgi:rubrerythrin
VKDYLSCVCGWEAEVERPDEDEAWDCPQCGAYHLEGTCPLCAGWTYDPPEAKS